jgi:hypothetical protein
MGALANTRGLALFFSLKVLLVDRATRLGDLQYKKFGVTPEPEVRYV